MPSSPTSTATARPTGPPGWALLWIGLVGLVLALRFARQEFHWLTWADRDFVRASAPWWPWEALGSELSHGPGARLPGGAWPLLVRLGLMGREQPSDVFHLFFGLDVAGGLVLAEAARRRAGIWVAAVAGAVWFAPSPARGALLLLCNPSMMPFFLAVAQVALAVAVLRDRRWAWALWAWSACLAAQGHFLALLAFAVSGSVLLALRRAAFVHRMGWVGLGVALAYGPYAVQDAARGFPNTRALLAQDPLRTGGGGRPWVLQLDEAWTSVLHLVPQAEAVGAGALGWLPAVLTLVLAAAGAAAFARAQRDLRHLGAVAVLSLVANLAVPALDPQIEPDLHYVLAVVPSFVLLVAAGAHALREAAPPRVQGWLTAGLTLTLAAPFAAEAWHLRVPSGPPDVFTWSGREAVFRTLEDRYGWSPAEQAGRLFFAYPTGSGWALTGTDGMDWVLARADQPFPGSLPPPCVAVFGTHANERAPGGTDIAAVLGEPPDAYEVLDRIQVSPRMVLLRYDPGTPTCPTLASNRYVDTPVELQLRPLFRALDDGIARPLLSAPPMDRYAVPLVHDTPDFAARVITAVDLLPRADGLAVTLHSAQLRGASQSHGGWLGAGLVSDPTLRFVPVEGGSAVDLPLAAGFVGLNHRLAPLHAAVTLEPGAYSVRLRARLYDLTHGQVGWPVPPSPFVDLDVLVTPRLVVGPP